MECGYDFGASISHQTLAPGETGRTVAVFRTRLAAWQDAKVRSVRSNARRTTPIDSFIGTFPSSETGEQTMYRGSATEFAGTF